MNDSNNPNNVNVIDVNNNKVEYKGQFGGDDNEDDDEIHLYEYGAHFKYKSLCDKLEQLLSVRQIENKNISTPYNRNCSHKLSNTNNKHITNFTVQSRNFYLNRNVGNHNKDNNNDIHILSVVANIKCKNNFTFSTKTVTNNNNINNKQTPALSGYKNKNVSDKQILIKTKYKY